MDIEAWLAAAQADADRRGLPELKPLLAGLAAATRAVRGLASAGPPAAAPPSHDTDRDHR